MLPGSVPCGQGRGGQGRAIPGETGLGLAICTRLGYHTGIVSNGIAVLDALRRGVYTAVLVDCQMPEMDGYVATRAIRRLEQEGILLGAHRRTPIIATATSAMAGDHDRCLANGLDDYLTQPASAVALQATLQR